MIAQERMVTQTRWQEKRKVSILIDNRTQDKVRKKVLYHCRSVGKLKITAELSCVCRWTHPGNITASPSSPSFWAIIRSRRETRTPISGELCSKTPLAPSQGSLYIHQASMGNTGPVRAMHGSYFRFYVFDSRECIRRSCVCTFARPQSSSAATAPNFELAPTTNFEIYSTTATPAAAERITLPFKMYVYIPRNIGTRIVGWKIHAIVGKSFWYYSSTVEYSISIIGHLILYSMRTIRSPKLLSGTRVTELYESLIKKDS